MEIVNLQDWDLTLIFIFFPLLAIIFTFLNILDQPTRDILLKNDEEIKKEVLATKQEILASNDRIIDLLEKKVKK